MRKTLAFFMSVFILFLSLYICVFATVNSEKEKVVITESYIHGDRKYADKADINFKVNYYSHLLWDISYDIAANKVEAGFDICRQGFQRSFKQTNRFELYGYSCDFTVSGGTDGTVEYYGYLAEAFKGLVADATPYEEVKKVVNVSDYIDYYPITLEIDFGDKYRLHSSLGYNNTAEEQLAAQIQDFLRIPVLKNHLVTISATVNESGDIFQSGSSSVASSAESPIYDEYSLYGESVITDDRCLIYFSNKTYNGKSIDTDEIPGGYGIYCLPYSYSENGDKVIFHGDKLANIFPVDNEHEISHLKLSESGKQIYMITDEGKDCFLTVLDAENYEVMQRINVSIFENQFAGLNYVAKDLVVVNLYHEHADAYFTLFTADKNGLLKKEFTSPVYAEIKAEGRDYTSYIGTEIYENSVVDAEWDGENLYVTNDFDESNFTAPTEKSGFRLCVYNKDGLQYYGNYYTSLSAGYDGSYASGYNTRLSDYDIIDITLK